MSGCPKTYSSETQSPFMADLVEQYYDLSPVLVFNSGPIFEHPSLDLKSFRLEDQGSDEVAWDAAKRFKESLKREVSEFEGVPGVLYHNSTTHTDHVDLVSGHSDITSSKKQKEMPPETKDDNDFFWLKRCLSVGSSNESNTAYDKVKFKQLIRRRMSDSLLLNVDSIRRSYASKAANDRVKTKGSLLKNWMAGPRQLFSKSSNPKNEANEKDNHNVSPRIGRKLLMPMLNRPGSYLEILKGRRSSDPSIHSYRDQYNELTDSAENSSSDDEQPDLHNGAFDVCVFKQEDIKVQSLLEEILRAHLLCMREYNLASCDQASRHITKLVTRLVRSMKETDTDQVKIACQVYIGAVHDRGIHTAVQALWHPGWDNFASASFRNDAVFGIVVVFVIPC